MIDPDESTCAHCNGTGRAVPCETCHGEGVLDNPSGEGTVPCPHCDGDKCPRCDGLGEKML